MDVTIKREEREATESDHRADPTSLLDSDPRHIQQNDIRVRAPEPQAAEHQPLCGNDKKSKQDSSNCGGHTGGRSGIRRTG